MTEKAVLYILLAEPVTGCAFARWHIMLPSCLDMLTSLGKFAIKQTLFYLTIFFAVIYTYHAITWTEKRHLWPCYGYV